MIRINRLTCIFVDTVPEQLVPGKLYIALRYKTITHLCCCGCGSEVVTPLSPVQWRFVFDGEAVSLHPSVGNWNLPCRSHYIIKDGKVLEADPWSDKQIAYGQARDKRARESYYGDRISPPRKVLPDEPGVIQGGWLRYINRLFERN